MLGTYHLNSLFDILKEIHFIYDPDKLWKYVLEEACKTLQSEGGTFFLSIKDDTELEVAAAHGVEVDRLKQVPFRAGVGICGWVLQYHQAALVANVDLDNRFNRAVDAVTGVTTQSLLCVPILSQKRTYGVMELINKKSGQFNPQDQEFMTVLGRQAAAAYQNLLLYQEVNHTKTLLNGVLENLTGGLIAIDLKDELTILNPAASKMLDVLYPKPVGMPAMEVLKDQPWFVEILKKTLTEKKTVSRQEVRLTLKGKECKVGYTTILISDPQKKLMGSGIIFQQLSN